ncbi:LANO_0G13234g1_1 [Lachancea nothofagi CBS 11611]|uniref:LANO_0G13234g1_1 n=1 Tax=Lachancea nothofagi CBS 11611 TaxID=1266666 RepID=A0A1G4KK04_9SACH|nr:LANO_0G13234g1_1 [Lachancea nothofagi CBS 11611]
MLIHRFGKVVVKPFENLSALDRLIQLLRLGSSVMVIIFTALLTLGALVSPSKIYMGRMNSSSANIADGLFQVLTLSVEESFANSINNAVGLTTAEILILTEYTASQVKYTPQYIVSSLYGWCRVDNKTAGERGSKAQNYTSCTKVGSDYIFDYRNLMEEVGLDVILDFAYSTSGSDYYEEDASYSHYMSVSKTMKVRMINLLYVVGVSQVLMLTFTLWYYSIKGRSLNQLKESLMTHIISMLSLLVCICALVSTISLVYLNLQVRSKIKSELDVLGISYHLGSAWFSSLSLLAFFSCVSCAVWSGLVWCITDQGILDDNSYELGILASTTQSIQEEDPLKNTDVDLSDLPKPSIIRAGTSQSRLLDSNSLEILRPVATSRSNYSFAEQKAVEPRSAFNL